jgi:cytochrome c
MKTHRFASRVRSLLFCVGSMSMAFACSDDGSSAVGNGSSGGSGGTNSSSTGSNTSTSSASTGMTSGAGGSAGASTGSGGLDDASAGSAGAPDASSGTGGARMDASVADQKSDVPVPVWEQDDPNLIPPDSAYQRVKMPVSSDGVISIDVTDDDKVFVLERAGKLTIWKPDGTIVNAGTIDTFSGNEDGALSISLDPNFTTNHWVYIFYSSNTVVENRLARFEIKNDQLDLTSEKILLKVTDERIVQWHVGGGSDFDSKGNLYLGLGDNTNPFESDGYAPLDETPGRSVYDSQRSAGNSKEFRGKILRITPKPDGTYGIPAGNLFTDGSGLPEIYVMGDRNPFRVSVDRGTDWLYWGEVGPDAAENADQLTTRGPKGYDEFNQAKAAGNFGWPYCIANNIPYVKYDFANKTSGAPYNCAAPVNNSPNNTGVKNLPPAQPAWIAYSYGSSPYPAMGTTGGRTAMAGSIYRWQPGGSINKVPRHFDGSVFLLEYTRGWIDEARTDAAGKVTAVNTFLASMTWPQVIQMRISKSGVMYVATHGGPSTVYRVNYVGHNNQPPVAVASSDVDSGAVPLTVHFSSQGSADPENQPLTYQWDFQNDGTVDSTMANPTFVYTQPGTYQAKLTVSDGMATSTAIIEIDAGNTRPVITISSPPAGAFVGQNELVDYTVSVTDREDGSTPTGIPCNSVISTPALGHDVHQHDGLPLMGCTGNFVTATGLIATENTWELLDVKYTDRATAPVPNLTGKSTVLLHFKRIEAEHTDYIGGANDVMTQSTSDPLGGNLNVGWINDGSWLCWNQMNFTNITSVTYRVASAGSGGRIEIH